MNEDTKKTCDRIEILGQIFSYPKTIYGTLSVFFISIALVGIVYIIAVKANPIFYRTVSNVWSSGIATSEGENIQYTGRYLIQFWTPSMKTKHSKEHAPWEILESDEKLIEFGDLLTRDPRVYGFRRYEVVGRGIRDTKYGYWWVMNVTNDYKLADLTKAYNAFWKNEGSIYVEVLREGGKHLNAL